MIKTVEKPPLESVMPYFQPILAADTGDVYAYEVLGRYKEGSKVCSLGAFFASAKSDEALEVDRAVRRRAMREFSQFSQYTEDEGGMEKYLFLNIRLNWIARYADKPEELPTLKWAKEFGIDFRKIVIEITEEDFLYKDESFEKVIAYYKDIGCRIAIDDFGVAASKIDRLSQILPDIIKIDMSYVHQSEVSLHYREYLKSLTSFAEKVGIEVLYEGIETSKQLDNCVSAGGRFYQGFLLAKPQPSMVDAIVNQDLLVASINSYVDNLRENLDQLNKNCELWDARIETFIRRKGSVFEADKIDRSILEIGIWLDTLVKRIYICDSHGNQLSSNIEVNTRSIDMRDLRGSNWGWRGFFQEAMAALNKGANSYMTNTYRDVSGKEKIQTFIYRIHADMYLFIDITSVPLVK